MKAFGLARINSITSRERTALNHPTVPLDENSFTKTFPPGGAPGDGFGRILPAP
jgi:hypothetical protein